MANIHKTSIDHEKFGLLIEKVDTAELNSMIALSILIIQKYNACVPVIQTLNDLLGSLQNKYQIFFLASSADNDDQSKDAAYLLVAAMIILLKAFKLTV